MQTEYTPIKKSIHNISVSLILCFYPTTNKKEFTKMTMTKDELKSHVESFLQQSPQLCNNFFNNEVRFGPYKWDEDCVVEFKTHFNGDGLESVDSYGGEGQGETYYTVYKFTSGDTAVYVKFSGIYYSYTGSTFEEYTFVEPKEVTITVYE